MLERQIEETCSEWLALDGWRTLKTDPVSDRHRGKGFGELGMADRLYIRYHGNRGRRGSIPINPEETLFQAAARAEIMWIEWKRQIAPASVRKRARGGVRSLPARSTKAAAHQTAWRDAERALGALTLIAGVDFEATIEGFKAWYLNHSGLRERVRS